VCETIGQSPELRAANDATERDDTGVALDELVANSVRFWAAHERLLEPLYGVAAVDAAAARLVDRQRRDRTSVLRAGSRSGSIASAAWPPGWASGERSRFFSF
jgi:hypothetical protein